MTGQKLIEVLSDPQMLNSYLYTRGNPIKNIDPNGKWTQGQIEGAQYLYDNSSVWRAAMDHPYVAGAAVGVGAGAVAYGAAAGATALSVQYLGGAGTACVAFCNQNGQQLAQQGVNNLHKLEDVSSAVGKMVSKGQDVGIKGVNNFINAVQDKGTAYLDNKTGNINIFAERTGGSGYLRMTLNPEMTRVISAGLNQVRNVTNGISNGRFVELGSKIRN